jgi:VIT1/CCC1 family predicted Fe2+/Mn2+ transporter
LSSEELVKVAKEGVRDELTDYTVYTRLANSKGVKDPELKTILSRLAETEFRHYQFWKKIYGGDVKINRAVINFILLLRRFLGITFVVKYLERHENKTIRKYNSIEGLIPKEDLAAFKDMLKDEQEHEIRFVGQIKEGRLKYISFIVLGLADALVEIAGIHAGSLAIYRTTELAGLAGIVAGAAASIAMASAAYAQAKQGFQGSASVSAVYTGVSYFITAVFLATPYFLTTTMTTALFASLVVAVLIIAAISYYSAVISGGRFRKDFLEITAIMFGATVALYALGTLIRMIFGIVI